MFYWDSTKQNSGKIFRNAGGVMRGEAMTKVCALLKSQGIDMGSMSALEFFAREGDWQTIAYAKEVSSLEAWEIEATFLPGLRKNLPGSIIRIVDSFEYGTVTRDRFDFIVLDNPQGVFGPKASFCEHFEALPIAIRLLQKRGFIVFNLNFAPFDLNQQPEWARRREQFYGIDETESLSVTGFLLPHYKRFFESKDLKIVQSFFQLRNDEYLAYAVFQLEKL
ncbi:hypothetical protein C9975_01730 [Thalassospira xiamenensis]|nr:hypothetical protein C9975_01730 [Thalassospira xiamenensis]